MMTIRGRAPCGPLLRSPIAGPSFLLGGPPRSSLRLAPRWTLLTRCHRRRHPKARRRVEPPACVEAPLADDGTRRSCRCQHTGHGGGQLLLPPEGVMAADPLLVAAGEPGALQ